MSDQKATKMVFFDAAGTLFDVRNSVGEIYAHYAWQYGKRVDPPAVQQAFVRQFRQQPPMAFACALSQAERQQQEKQWWRNLVQEVFAGFGEFPHLEEYFEEIFAFFRTAAAWELRADTLPTLETLKQRGLRLGVISNFDARLYDVLRAFGLLVHFDSIHISSEVGAAKPETAIFAAALRDNYLAASQVMHVGDSWSEDVQGASAAGWRAVWINPEPAATTTTDVVRVSNLHEIINLI